MFSSPVPFKASMSWPAALPLAGGPESPPIFAPAGGMTGPRARRYLLGLRPSLRAVRYHSPPTIWTQLSIISGKSDMFG